MTRTRPVDSQRVRDDADAGDGPRWITRWVDDRRGLQLVVVSSAKPGRRPRLDDALVVSIARWSDKIPGSLRGERRWDRVAECLPGDPAWTRWQQLYEAGHISHHSGRDADISYVTVDDDHHFAVALDAMDVTATWRWLELLVATGDDLNIPVERIFIDRSVRRHLAARLPRAAKRTRLWRSILQNSGGHDAHHHVRTRPISAAAERRAAAALDKRLAAAPPANRDARPDRTADPHRDGDE